MPVANTQIAKDFYTTVVGLPFAYRDPTRDIIFLWAGSKEEGMIGLWGPGTAYGPKNGIARKCHIALALSFDQLLTAIKKLNECGIKTFGFGGHQTDEPNVIGWMPSAQIYFRDPDGHTVEFINILPDAQDATFIGTYSSWEGLTKRSSNFIGLLDKQFTLLHSAHQAAVDQEILTSDIRCVLG